jgi:hypothetical protein
MRCQEVNERSREGTSDAPHQIASVSSDRPTNECSAFTIGKATLARTNYLSIQLAAKSKMQQFKPQSTENASGLFYVKGELLASLWASVNQKPIARQVIRACSCSSSNRHR